MRFRGVPEFDDERMPLERLLHDAALNALAAAVNQPDLTQSGVVRRVDVFLDDRRRRRAARTRAGRGGLRWGCGGSPRHRYVATGIGRGDDGLHAAANGEIANDRHAPRRAGGDEVVEDLVRHRFVEDAAVAELDHVVLQRLQLDAAVAGHVGDADFAEVGEPGLRTDGGELGTADRDLEVALGTWIRKGLQRPRA